MTQIIQPLTRLFDRNRIVFWYDAKCELRHEFDALDLPDVEKVELANNEFGVKYRVLRGQPDVKFLLYHEGPPPADAENWLLDLQLANTVFSADQSALWLSEVGLSVVEFGDLAAEHADFFKAANRRAALKELLKSGDLTPSQIRLKMLAVCAGTDARIDEIVEQLLLELSQDKDDRLRLIQRVGLEAFLWIQLERVYGYRSDNPGMADFAIELFKSGYAAALGEDAGLNRDAQVFLRRWKNSSPHQAAFRILSVRYAAVLAIQDDLAQRDYQQLGTLDLFELVDRRILSDLVRAVANRTISAAACAQFIRGRRQGHWYAKYAHEYQAIEAGAHFIALLDKANLRPQSMGDGIRQYAASWYRLDQQYRHCIYHAQRSGQTTLLSPLVDQVELLYSNSYLLPLNDRWQTHVDAVTGWEAAPTPAQGDFYASHVRRVLGRGYKLYVIISDALRYEVAEELLRRIRQEDRYEAELSAGLSGLPSHTKLGMAALLPHERIEYSADAKTVLVDGQSSQGTANRSAILAAATKGAAVALRADDLLNMSRDESRAVARDHDLIYIYHNRIDAAGDKRDTEERTFEAVEAALDELILLIKKLANANANNMIVTADHGFIYQHDKLDDSEYAAQAAQGDEILERNRRYVLGRGLHANASFKKFTADQVGLDGDMELLIPKSINRLRVSGSGSRYVHGGAALQEVVVPVLSVSKKRATDISRVNVELLRGSSSTITSGQFTVRFYQSEAVTAKVQPVTLRAGLYNRDGGLISDRRDLTFDLTSDDPREREMSVQFVLTRAADDANGQEVVLRLDEREGDTSHFRQREAARYLLRRSFTSDFDF